MGVNVVPLKDLTPEETKVLTLELLKSTDPDDARNEKSRGQLVLEVTYKPFKEDEIPDDPEDSGTVEKAPEGTPDGGGLLVITVHQAQDVEGKHHTNPYVRLLLKGEERKTKVCHVKKLSANASCASRFPTCIAKLDALTLVFSSFIS